MKTMLLTSGLVALAFAVAGCGGGAKTPRVAHLGSSTSPRSSSAGSGGSSSGSGGSSSGASGSQGGSASPDSQAVAYSACVRAHGVPNFPDPKVSTHGNEVRVAIGINPSISSNPQFKSAQQACRKLLPGGGPGASPHPISPQEQTQYLKAAACVRSHGVPDFPDPTFSGGGVHIEHQGLNESSPTFKAAVHACESLVPAAARNGG